MASGNQARGRPRSKAAATTLDEAGVVAAYARWAPIYDWVFGGIIWSAVHAATREINRMPPGRVLEVGVGTGIALPRYDRAHRIVGIDLSPDMLKRAEKRVIERQLSHVEALAEMDASRLSFPDGSFDIVAAMFVMPVVPDPERVLAEMARVARPGGRIVLANHFAVNGGPIAAIERWMSRHSTKLGWHPGFPIERVLNRPDLKLLERRSLQPLGLYQLLVFERI